MSQKPLSKLIFVDDDEDTLTIAKYCLQQMKGVESKFVSSGEAAIEEAIRFQPDLIILDVMMPKMDGFSTLKAIRARKEISHIPVVFFTAKVQKEEISSYFESGAIDVIVKPFDPLKLGETIQTIWEKYQERTK